MARLARAIFPGIPHHVTQRGSGGAQTFFRDDDYRLYRDLLAEHAAAAGVEVWSWVLMPNHVHLILVPPDPDALRRTLAAVHRRYAGQIHARLERTGHFWQGRFGCVAMDEDHLGWRCAMWRSIRSGRGWWRGWRTSRGSARRCIWAGSPRRPDGARASAVALSVVHRVDRRLGRTKPSHSGWVAPSLSAGPRAPQRSLSVSSAKAAARSNPASAGPRRG